MPTFSIVVPTRNRANLLEHNVIPNLLRLNSKDHEIVFCDNASSDNTEKLIKAYAKDYDHIKYFRSNDWIPKEQFFQWSWKKAQGDYITLFFDDDYLSIRALEKVDNLLSIYETDIITYNRACVYTYPDYPVESLRNNLNIPDFDRKAYKFNSRRHLENIYYLNDIYLPTPMVTNAFYKRTLLDQIENEFGEFFLHGHMGDFNIACLTLNSTSDFIYLNDPLAIFGFWSQNTQAQLHDLKTTMPEYQEWIAWFTKEYLSWMPYKEYVWPNNIAATLIEYSQKLNLGLKVNDRSHIISILRNLNELKVIYPTKEEHDIDKMIQGLKSHSISLFGSQKTKDIFKSMDIPPPSDIVEELKLYNSHTPEIYGFTNQIRFNGKGIFNNISDAGWFFEGVTGEAISTFRPHLHHTNNEDTLPAPVSNIQGNTIKFSFRRKIKTLKRVIKTEGLKGIIRVIKLKFIQRGAQI